MAEGPVAKATLGRLTGDVKSDLSTVKKEIRDVEQHIGKIAKAGGKVEAQFERLKRLQALSQQLKADIVRGNTLERAEKNVKLFNALTRVQSFKSLLSGNFTALDAANLIDDKKVEKALQRIGLKRIAGAVSAIAPVVGIGLVAYEEVKAGIKRYQQETQNAKNIGTLFGAGHISQAEFEIFQKANRPTFFGDPLEHLQAIQKAGARLSKTDIDVRDKVVLKALQATQKEFIEKRNSHIAWMFNNPLALMDNADAAGHLSINGINEAIAARLQGEQRRLGRELTSEEREEDFRAAFAEYVKSLPEDVARSFSDKLDETAQQEAIKTKRRKTGTEIYRERLKERQADYVLAQRDARFRNDDRVFHIGD